MPGLVRARTLCGNCWMDRKNRKTIYVYGTQTDIVTEENFEKRLSVLPDFLQEKVLKCRNFPDRQRRLSGYLLLAHILSRWTMKAEAGSPNLAHYRTEAGGKPYLCGYPEIQFNLSHSGRYAVCAVSSEPVGIDIQERRERHGNLAARFFSQEENEQLAECHTEEEREELFFRFWCAREAYVKWTGTGLSRKFSSLEVNLKSGTVMEWTQGAEIEHTGKREAYIRELFSEVFSKDYFLTVCSGKEAEIELEIMTGKEWMEEL